MATRDYVGNGPRRRQQKGRATKKAPPRRFPIIPIAIVCALLAGFTTFLYMISGKGRNAPSIEEQVKANKPKMEESALPREKWSYIERLENKQVDVSASAPSLGTAPPKAPETPKRVDSSTTLPATPITQPNRGQLPEITSGAPVSNAQEQLIDRQQIEREIRAELERERMAAANRKTAQDNAAQSGRYIMQCAALRAKESAESLKARIALTTGLASTLEAANSGDAPIYKVLVGPFNNKAAAESANKKLQSSGISGCILKQI